MKKAFAAAAALFVCAPAMAQPVISGKYIVTIHEYCQPTMTTNFIADQSDGNIVNNVALGASSVQMTMLVIGFNSTKLTASFSGFGDESSLVIFKTTGTIVSTTGDPVGEMPGSGKVAYSNTDTTLTFGGQVFNAFYGQIDKKNVAHYATFQGVVPGEGATQCMEQGEAALQ